MQRAADEACSLVAAQFSLRPVDVRDGADGAALVGRWIAWHILRNVTGWTVRDIYETFSVRKQTVYDGLTELGKRIEGRRADKALKARVEACLREAAGGGT